MKFSQLGQKAGLGCIGQSGLLISPELGPRQKISAIFVSIANLPIKKAMNILGSRITVRNVENVSKPAQKKH